MLGFIQGLLLIIIEVSIYFFYAQTFCEAGDKITVRRTIATVVISAELEKEYCACSNISKYYFGC